MKKPSAKVVNLLIAKSILETVLVGTIAVAVYLSAFPPTFHGWGEAVAEARTIAGWVVSDADPWRRVEVQLFGGTPTNIASMFLEEGAVEVVTGVNLPMVIKLATATAEDSLAEIARKICDQGRQGIYLAGALLATPPKPGAD